MTVDFDGKIWKPIPGGTATAEEFIAAYSLIREIHRLLLWSPWVMQDRAKEYDAAWKTCEQWTSTEPGPSAGKTVEEHMAEVEQRLAEADARFLAEEAQAEKDRAERATRYDSERAEARLAMLEEQGILADKIRERDEIVSGELFPLVSENKRRELLGSLERDIAAKTKEIDDLIAVIGDPESVADANGWLPRERRELALTFVQGQAGNGGT